MIGQSKEQRKQFEHLSRIWNFIRLIIWRDALCRNCGKDWRKLNGMEDFKLMLGGSMRDLKFSEGFGI
jgi:hypothetical protein